MPSAHFESEVRLHLLCFRRQRQKNECFLPLLCTSDEIWYQLPNVHGEEKTRIFCTRNEFDSLSSSNVQYRITKVIMYIIVGLHIKIDFACLSNCVLYNSDIC